MASSKVVLKISWLAVSIIVLSLLYFDLRNPLGWGDILSFLEGKTKELHVSSLSSAQSRAPSAKHTFAMEHCKCNKTISAGNWGTDGSIPYENTTCGREAYQRGTGQKVVGFSFYGDRNSDYGKLKGYFEGIEGNLALMPKYYPGWIMRVYFDLDPSNPVLQDMCNLACKNELLDLCHVGKLPGTPTTDARKVFSMNWRFFPCLDPQVDMYVSRDLDNRFTDREQAAVSEWLDSSSALHVMRDNPQHSIEILGSSWGLKTLDQNVRDQWRKGWSAAERDVKLYYAPRGERGPDQFILARYLWPLLSANSIGHDSYFCMKFPNTRPWPTKRLEAPNNFISAVWLQGDQIGPERGCPAECRPKDHQDWTLC